MMESDRGGVAFSPRMAICAKTIGVAPLDGMNLFGPAPRQMAVGGSSRIPALLPNNRRGNETDMEKMDMRSMDPTQGYIEQLGALFPECVTEIKTESGGGGGAGN